MVQNYSRLLPLDPEGKNDQAGTSNADQTQEKSTDAGGTLESQEHQHLDFTEFDFDTEAASTVTDTAKLLATQRRPLGGSALSVREKPVARLQKILKENFVRQRLEQDYMRQIQTPHQKQDPERETLHSQTEVSKEENVQIEAPEEATVETTEASLLPRDIPFEAGDLSNGPADALQQ